MAALLAVKLAVPLNEVLEVSENKIFYWTDSMNALQSIKNRTGALKRIAKIRRELSPTQCNYVKTDDNLADLPYRGLAAHNLKEQKKWWYGAEYLQCNKKNQPK